MNQAIKKMRKLFKEIKENYGKIEIEIESEN